MSHHDYEGHFSLMHTPSSKVLPNIYNIIGVWWFRVCVIWSLRGCWVIQSLI